MPEVTDHQNISVLMFDAAYPPPVTGGKEKQAHLLSRSLVRRGVRVKAISYTHNKNQSGEHEGVSVDRFPRGIAAVPFLFWYLIKYRSQFNILHIHTPSRIGKLAAVSGFLLGYKIVFKFPNMYLLDNNGLIESAGWWAVLKLSHLLVALEEDTRQKLGARHIPAERIFQVSNGVEISPHPGDGKNNKEFNILFVGRLVPQKRCEDLIRACALLDTGKVNWQLAIVGDGPLFQELKDSALRLGVADRVFFKGYQADTLSHMKKADLLVLPSKNEGMSNVLLEAMSVGLPVIATRVGGAEMQTGSMGEPFLYEPGDIRTLVQQMEKMINDQDLRCLYGKYLRDRCRDGFSMETISRLYIEKYRDIV